MQAVAGAGLRGDFSLGATVRPLVIPAERSESRDLVLVRILNEVSDRRVTRRTG